MSVTSGVMTAPIPPRMHSNSRDRSHARLIISQQGSPCKHIFNRVGKTPSPLLDWCLRYEVSQFLQAKLAEIICFADCIHEAKLRGSVPCLRQPRTMSRHSPNEDTSIFTWLIAYANRRKAAISRRSSSTYNIQI